MADDFKFSKAGGAAPQLPTQTGGLFGINRTRVTPMSTSGSDGVYAYGGRLISYERKPELAGRNLFTTFDNAIVGSCIVGAAVRYFQALIGGTAWSVAPKESAGANGVKAAKIVQEGLFEANMTLPWSSVVKKAGLFKYYGFSIHEWCVRRRKDGMIVFKDIEHRPQHTIDMWDIPEDGGGFRGVVQLVPSRPELYYVNREQMLYCVDNTLTDAPNGVGLLRHVVEHARRLERYEELEGFGYEGDMRGMPVAKVPGAELEAMAANQPPGWMAQQLGPVHSFIRNHLKTPFQGLVLDSAPYNSSTLGAVNPAVSPVPKWTIDILKGESMGLADINVVIERINREIARVLGMEFLLLGGDGKGSLALSQDKTSMFAAMLEATLSELAWFAYHDLVYPLLELNGLDPEVCAPQVNPDPIATERIETVITALVGMAQAGAPIAMNDPAINQIRGRLHLADQPKMAPELMAGPRAPGAPRPKPEQPGGSNPDDVDQEDRPGAQGSESVGKRGRKLFRHNDDTQGA